MVKINGLIAATFATFHVDGSLNLDGIPPLVDKLVDDGLKGVFICGTNGEGPNLTVEERMAVAEAYVASTKGRLLVLVHVGHTSIAECRKLAAHAEKIGADAISAVAAFYFKPANVVNLVDSMAQIAAAAPDTPFYYYHIPALTGVGMDMVEFLRLGEEKIPNLAGIKYTAATIHEYQACLNFKAGKFDVLFGYDELLLPALAVGANGAVGSTYNFAAPLYLRVMELFKAGHLHEAQQLQLLLVNMIREMVKFSPIPAQKAIMEMTGMDLGPSRLPLVSLSEQDKKLLQTRLEAIGFFDVLKQIKPVNDRV
ncbi:dihydrodipicolinate synthase family protein [Parapedobacter indicus]|uniref:N-acetylneuraminate lyase n=1 Tax=Parapedobacter indicus TaxID=1477437 RepID=A0A1I3D9R8_9SPHI|nr:dihydrodipicolinate synthase family protein [Parapedobacter indicus]PPL04584.1 N-acetylneuraminate lyase [Parapedobacter indicus]SFH83455.1 N-acetylneuraminate lyase [Parapedobacter indicus]